MVTEAGKGRYQEPPEAQKKSSFSFASLLSEINCKCSQLFL